MKLKTGLFLILVFGVRVLTSQDVRFRKYNDVAMEIYHRYDENKVDLKIPAPLLHEDIGLFVRTIEEVGVDPYINLLYE